MPRERELPRREIPTKTEKILEQKLGDIETKRSFRVGENPKNRAAKPRRELPGDLLVDINDSLSKASTALRSLSLVRRGFLDKGETARWQERVGGYRGDLSGFWNDIKADVAGRVNEPSANTADDALINSASDLLEAAERAGGLSGWLDRWKDAVVVPVNERSWEELSEVANGVRGGIEFCTVVVDEAFGGLSPKGSRTDLHLALEAIAAEVVREVEAFRTLGRMGVGGDGVRGRQGPAEGPGPAGRGRGTPAPGLGDSRQGARGGLRGGVSRRDARRGQAPLGGEPHRGVAIASGGDPGVNRHDGRRPRGYPPRRRDAGRGVRGARQQAPGHEHHRRVLVRRRRSRADTPQQCVLRPPTGRDAGGDVFIVADSIGSDSELTVRCSGGKGGRGLQGEDGGNGGDGGNGVDEHFIANDAWGGVDYYFNQAIEGAPGGRGGDGGIGGPGGRGGASGNCTIVVILSGVVQNLEFDKMFGKITDDLEHWVSRTPTKQEDYTGTGVCVMLKQDQYPHEFKQLRESGVARFSVPLPRIGYERFRLRLHQPLPGRAKTVTASELREALRGAKILLIRSKVGSRTDESIRIAGDKDTPAQIEVHVTERTGEPDLLIVRAVKEGITSAYCTVRDEGAGTSPKSGRIASLRQRHRSLFAQPRPKPGDAREQIIDDVAAIAGKIDARHQSLVIVSSHGWDLFDTPPSPQFVIRVFDERGKLAAEATEADLRKRRDAAKVDAFKERLRPFWKRPSLTWEEEQRIIEDVAGVLDQKALWEPKTKTNAFDGHAEVRVTKVRAWVFGVTSDDMKCHVDLKHMGNEVFRRADGAVIGLAHGPIDGIRFSYNWSNVLWNVPGGYVEKPEVSLKHDGIDADLLLQGKYASADNIPLIGPFAEWEIRIESGKHKNLDRTKITSICLDFHVLSKAITTGPLPPAPAR